MYDVRGDFALYRCQGQFLRPIDCIYEGDRFLYINPAECVDCAACEQVCPVEAIYSEYELPAELASYQAINSDFFTEVLRMPAPGGASRVTVNGLEHPEIATMPRADTASG